MWLILSAGLPVRAEVPWGYEAVAAAYGLPARVLYAVALTESASKLPYGLRPWPWTLNVGGRPMRFATRVDAWRALIGYLLEGRTNIDVGLMQVNWGWHKARLADPWTALDPYHNLRVGAKILLEEYQKTGDWPTAIGRYHAPGNPQRAERYRRMVERYLR